MKIGLQIMRFDWPDHAPMMSQRLRDIATLADQSGFASLWVMDHFFQMGGQFGPADDPMLEGYSSLGYLAALTTHIKLGTLVTGAIYRNPGLLAKTISTLDVLSGGRMYLGLGAGWYQREARGLGFDFPPVSERFERLEETLQIVKQMWAGQRTPYSGRHYQLQEPINSPQPIQQPHPPILIGGAGERKTLRLVAQYADACNLYAGQNPNDYAEELPVVQHKLEVLRQHCDALQRPYSTIERTALGGAVLTRDPASVAPILRLCESLAGMGIQHVIFNMPNMHELWPIELLAQELLPAVRGL